MATLSPADRERFQRILEATRARQAAAAALAAAASATAAPAQAAIQAPVPEAVSGVAPIPAAITGTGIILNERQTAFINKCLEPNLDPVILLGPAGTGKTTAVGGLLRAINAQVALPQIVWQHKHLPHASAGILFCSFTRRATNNIRKRLPEDFQQNCVTIHKLLEFAPEFVSVVDEKTGESKNSRVFRPRRTLLNPLPHGIKYLIIDEASMLGSMLWEMLAAALPAGVKVIFVGDLCQLLPVMDQPAWQAFLCKCPTIELVEVYRQALDNPIVKFATDIRRGIPFMVKEHMELVSPDGKGKLTLHPWKKAVTPAYANRQLGMFFTALMQEGKYDPWEDQILCPFDACETRNDKSPLVGNLEINRHIATAISRAKGLPVFEILGGFEKQYFAVGDLVIFDKNDAVILDIKKNANYRGKTPHPPSVNRDYWGHMQRGAGAQAEEEESDDLSFDEDEVDAMLASALATSVEDGERVRAASHVVKIQYLETGIEEELRGAGDINKLFLSYAMTVHKAQGSEWGRVFLVLHKCHASTLNRELLYTGFTRPKQELFVICEPDSFMSGVKNVSIKGNTLEEKAEFLRKRAKFAAVNAAARRKGSEQNVE